MHDRPFYRARLQTDGTIAPWDLGDLQAWVASTGDPYGGRRLGEEFPPVSLQLEATDDPPVWVGLDGDELAAWSLALERLLARWDLRAGETIAFFEYGSSPLVLLSAASYTPRLGRGAADRLGADVYCNDGIASMADRMVDALRMLRPTALVARADVMAPLVDAMEQAGLRAAEILRWVALTVADGAPYPAEVTRWSDRLEMSVRSVLRADAAYLIAGDCEACRLYHIDPELYVLETLPTGEVAVTAPATRTTPAVRYNLGPATVEGPGCPREPGAVRLRWS